MLSGNHFPLLRFAFTKGAAKVVENATGLSLSFLPLLCSWRAECHSWERLFFSCHR